MSLEDWKVYYVYNCKHTTPPKNKYVLTFKYQKGQYLGLFINSKMTRFASTNRRIRPCIVKVKAISNPFLKYASYINCESVHIYDDSELIHLKGHVCEVTQSHVVKAIMACPTMQLKWKGFLLDRYPINDFL